MQEIPILGKNLMLGIENHQEKRTIYRLSGDGGHIVIFLCEAALPTPISIKNPSRNGAGGKAPCVYGAVYPLRSIMVRFI